MCMYTYTQNRVSRQVFYIFMTLRLIFLRSSNFTLLYEERLLVRAATPL